MDAQPDILARLNRMEQSQAAFQREIHGEIQDLRKGIQDIRGEVQELIEQSQTAFQQEIRGDIRDLRNDIQDIRREVQELDIKSRAREYNGIARMRNGRAMTKDYKLMPLRALATNQNIPDFPVLSGDIRTMDETNLDSVLTSLGLPLTGRVSDKKSAVLFWTGLADIGEPFSD